MSMSKTVRSREHWTQRINRENRELKHLNSILLQQLKDAGSEFVVSVGEGYSSSSPTPVPSGLPVPSPDGGDGGGDDDEPPEGDDDERPDFAPSMTLMVHYSGEVKNFILTKWEYYKEFVIYIKMRCEGAFGVLAEKVVLHTKDNNVEMDEYENLETYLPDEPVPLMEINMTVDDSIDTYVIKTVFHDFTIVEDFGMRATHIIHTDEDRDELELRYILEGKIGIPYDDMKLMLGDEVVEECSSLSNLPNTIYRLGIRGVGGGKRAKPSTGASSGNLVAGLNKADALRQLEDNIGMTLMRCQQNHNASPAITQTCHKIWTIVNGIKGETFNFDNELGMFSLRDLEKLQGITTLSTKVEARCGELMNVIFKGEIDNLKELATQTDTVNSAMRLSTQLAVIFEFADEGGNIAWMDFLRSVGDAVKAQVENNAKKANTPRNGLGM